MFPSWKPLDYSPLSIGLKSLFLRPLAGYFNPLLQTYLHLTLSPLGGLDDPCFLFPPLILSLPSCSLGSLFFRSQENYVSTWNPLFHLKLIANGNMCMWPSQMKVNLSPLWTTGYLYGTLFFFSVSSSVLEICCYILIGSSIICII